EDIVEKIGVERSHQILAEADLVLFMLNNNEALTDDDREIFALLEDLNYIVIINKVDLERQIDWNEIKTLTKDNAMITTSLIEEKGIDNLEAALADLFFSSEVATDEAAYISNVRHIQLLKQAKLALEDATNALELNMPLDIVQIDIRRTWEFLGEIIGDAASESLIDQLFSQFCLGKYERVRILTSHAGGDEVIVVGARHAECESALSAA